MKIYEHVTPRFGQDFQVPRTTISNNGVAGPGAYPGAVVKAAGGNLPTPSISNNNNSRKSVKNTSERK